MLMDIKCKVDANNNGKFLVNIFSELHSNCKKQIVKAAELSVNQMTIGGKYGRSY